MKRIAAIQMASGPNLSANLNEAGRLISDAVDAGADLVVLPENFALIAMKQDDLLTIQEQQGIGTIQEFLMNMATKHRVWIVSGTVPMSSDDPMHIRAACLLINPEGEIVSRYDKIHLFDVSLGDGKRYAESDIFESGNEIVVQDTPFGRMGFGICYDLRFPEMFRRMLDQGVDVIVLPAAFTAITGKAHWETLVRARAIENLCYVVASAQGGYHANEWETHGDSMIVDPWGEILDRLPSGSGFVIADLDQEKTNLTRKQFPAIEHRKLECYKKSS